MFSWCCFCCPDFCEYDETTKPLLKRGLKGDDDDDDLLFLAFRKKILTNTDDVSTHSCDVRITMKPLYVEHVDSLLQNHFQLYNDHLDRWDDIVTDVVAFKVKCEAGTFREAVSKLKRNCDDLSENNWKPKLLSEYFIQIALYPRESSKTSVIGSHGLKKENYSDTLSDKNTLETNENNSSLSSSQTKTKNNSLTKIGTLKPLTKTTPKLITRPQTTNENDEKTLSMCRDLNELAAELRDFIQRHSSLAPLLKSLTQPPTPSPSLKPFTPDSSLNQTTLTPSSNYESIQSMKEPSEVPSFHTPSLHSQSQFTQLYQNQQQPSQTQQQQPPQTQQQPQQPQKPHNLFYKRPHLSYYEEVMNSCDEDDIREYDVQAAIAPDGCADVYRDSYNYRQTVTATQSNRLSDFFRDYSFDDYDEPEFNSSPDTRNDSLPVLNSKDSSFSRHFLPVRDQHWLSLSKSEYLCDQLDVRVCGFRNEMTLAVMQAAGDDQKKQISNLTILKSNLDSISRGINVTDTLDLVARQLSHHIYDAIGEPLLLTTSVDVAK